jgi:site-specific recombinase XerD
MGYSKRRRKTDDSMQEGQETASMTLDKALDAFLLYQDAVRHSKSTQSDYKLVIGLFLRYMGEKQSYIFINQITEVDILDWLAYLRNASSRWGRPYSSRTIQSYSQYVNTFFHWLTQHGHLLVNPMGQVKIPKIEKALIRVFTENELKLLDAACERDSYQALTSDERKALAARDRAFLWLLLSTGIRLSEACGLLFSDIDWDRGMIYVRGKGAKERKVPIGKVARQHLQTYIQYWRGVPTEDHEQHVFLNAFGNPLSTNAASDIFTRLKRVSGITDKRVSAHTCRHWFAVNCIKNGMPSTALQALLGHEHLEMINTYVRLAEQDQKDLYVRYSPVDGLEMHQAPRNRRQELRDWRNSRKKRTSNSD